jgi:hypothetical protein
MSNRRRTKVCRCEAYAFPHRLGSGKCRDERLEREAQFGMDPDMEYELRCYTRSEARAINRETRSWK